MIADLLCVYIRVYFIRVFVSFGCSPRGYTYHYMYINNDVTLYKFVLFMV